MFKKLLIFLFIAIFIASFFIGKFDFSTKDYLAFFGSFFGADGGENFEVIKTILLDIRLPRILACVLIGSALALSGAVYQGIFLNPLVSPSILGVLNGASFGAALGMVLGLSAFFYAVFDIRLWLPCRWRGGFCRTCRRAKSRRFAADFRWCCLLSLLRLAFVAT